MRRVIRTELSKNPKKIKTCVLIVYLDDPNSSLEGVKIHKDANKVTP